MKSLTIGQVAKQTGVSHDTIRLYERYGLIDWHFLGMRFYFIKKVI